MIHTINNFHTYIIILTIIYTYTQAYKNISTINNKRNQYTIFLHLYTNTLPQTKIKKEKYGPQTLKTSNGRLEGTLVILLWSKVKVNRSESKSTGGSQLEG